MRRPLLLLLTALGLAPAAVAAGPGRLTGTVDKPEAVTAVFAKDRTSEEKDRVYPGKIDRRTGRFVIDHLPLKATYDVVIDYAGARLEGVNLHVTASEDEEDNALTKEDIAALKKTARATNKFEDHFDFLAIRGNNQHAAVLLNKLRLKPFYGSRPGEIVWRLELFHYEKPEDTWVRDQDELSVVLYRERLQKKDFDRKSLTLDPRLGGLKLTVRKPALDLGKIELPPAKPGIRLRPEKTR